MLCSALENGPQAINISETKDVFNICDKAEDLMSLISHEIGSFIILSALTRDITINLSTYWVPIESLASYHNKKYYLKARDFFPTSRPLFETIDHLYKLNPRIEIIDVIAKLVHIDQ